MEAILLKQPYAVSFSRNPIPFSFAITPYGDTERRQIIRLLVKVSVERNLASGSFDEVKSQVFFPDAEGLINMDVSTLIDPYLEYYTPRPSGTVPVEATGHGCRYKIAWLLERDNVAVASLAETLPMHCIKGGLSFEEWHPSEFFAINVASYGQPLNWSSGDKIAPDALRYLYWIYPSANGALQTITLLLRGSNGNSYQHTVTTSLSSSQWAVYCLPVVVTASALALLPAGVSLIEVAIQITAGGSLIVNAPAVKFEYRNFYNTHTLLYRNSVGALETLRLRGQVDYEADYSRQASIRTLPSAYYKNLNLQSSVVSNSSEQEKWKGDTGFLSKQSIDGLRDLLLSNEVYEYKSGKLVPVVISAKSAKLYSNKDNLISLQIEWQNAHSNEAYTPAGTLPQTRLCPAMEKLEVTQLNKKTLQIMYAMPSPYNECEVEVIINGTTTLLNIEGNTKVVRHEITPVATSTAVQVRARVICNTTSVPADKGPFAVKNLTLTANSAVVANPDSFTIQNGFNSSITLPKSVLDNDYDPDGDALAVTAASGATTAGGSFSINAAGIIQYTPPSSAYVGTDTLTYQVSEAGGTSATATVTINVGTVASTVYAKAVKRNVVTTGVGTVSTENGQIWLEFFSDPSGSIPYDITALGLTINYQKKTVNAGSADVITNLSASGTGISVKVYEGELSRVNIILGINRSHQFKTIAGTGYIPI